MRRQVGLLPYALLASVLVARGGEARATVDCAHDPKPDLCAPTKFFDDARGVLGGNDFASFDEVLAPCYAIDGKYDEAALDNVLATLEARAPGNERDEEFYEASFRKAAAHGMFGDDALLRGLDPRSGGGGVGADQVIVEARQRLDSRVCYAEGTETETPCTSSADCEGDDICAPRRFNIRDACPMDGPFGAVQEYRRAEQALLRAIQALGFGRFREIDESGPRCLGVGCAARLLVRLGAMKARAQAERADLLWRRAAATSGVLSDALTCGDSPSARVCFLHRDCAPQRCGDGSPRQASTVLLRAAVAEALTEAAAAEALYRSLLPQNALAESSDWAQRAAALARLTAIESRSLNGLTPFGIPADYVPLLADVQKSNLDCLSQCSRDFCDRNSNAACLLRLAEGAGFQGLLTQARTAQDSAEQNAAAFAQSFKDRRGHETALKNDFKRVIQRLLGSPCSGCACGSEEQERGECVVFDEQVWQVEGARCDSADGSLPACEFAFREDLSGVDGEFERQLLAIRNAELGLDHKRQDLARNSETRRHVMQEYAALRGISEDQCGDTEAAYTEAGVLASDAIQRRHDALSPDLGDTLNAFSKGALVGAIQGLSKGDIFGAVLGGLFGGVGGLSGAAEQRKQQNALANFDRAIGRIQTEQQITLERINCEASQQTFDVQEDSALFQVETERRRLLADVAEHEAAVLDAVVGAQQLLTELRDARAAFDEATELKAIFDATDFRNPASYRALALAEQLVAADAFRSAQIVTWLILRAAAYDLALPDFARPQIFARANVLQLAECQRNTCSVGGNPCATQSQCTAGPTDKCNVPMGDAGVADSDRHCSLQAVFAARTVDDLEALISSAMLRLVATDRRLACTNGVCRKEINLRDIFTDAELPESSRPRFGDVLLNAQSTPAGGVALDFAISLKRGFTTCPIGEDNRPLCEPLAVANLSGDREGSGPLATDFWNARLLTARGVVAYVEEEHPERLRCRNPTNGTLVSANVFDCEGKRDGDLCGGQSGQCIPLLRPGQQGIDVGLVQLDPGVVRTRAAQSINNADPVDSLLRHHMRTGDLPVLGQAPPFKPFEVAFSLFENEMGPEDAIKGAPVASSRWQLRFNALNASTILRRDAYRDAFLHSIRDVTLILEYQAFRLPLS